MSRKKVTMTIYVTVEQDERLKALSARTKVPVAEYIRQGIDLLLERHAEELPGQRSWFGVGPAIPPPSKEA